MGVEYSLSSVEKYIGSVAIDSSSSFIRNMGVIRPWLSFGKIVVPWLKNFFFEKKQLVWSKVVTMNKN